MQFASQIAAPVPPGAQTVRVTSSTGAALNYSASAATTTCGNGWLVLGGTTTGTTDGQFTVSVNPSGIAAGSQCTGSVSISGTNPASGNNAPNSPVTIPVTLYVSNSALLVVSPTALSYTAPVGGAANPQTITVSSTSGTEQLNYTVSFASNPVGSNWMSLNTLSGSTAPGHQYHHRLGSPGSAFSGHLHRFRHYFRDHHRRRCGRRQSHHRSRHPAGHRRCDGGQPRFAHLQPDGGGSAPATQSLAVTSTGGSINYTVATSTGGTGNWLSATPASGSTPGTITVAANGANLPRVPTPDRSPSAPPPPIPATA